MKSRIFVGLALLFGQVHSWEGAVKKQFSKVDFSASYTFIFVYFQ